MAGEPRTPHPPTRTGAGPESLVLAQLRGVRRELATILDTQMRDRELFARHANRVEEAVSRIDRSIGDLRSDVILIENKLLTQTNEILDVLRRIDEAETVEDTPEPGRS